MVTGILVGGSSNLYLNGFDKDKKHQANDMIFTPAGCFLVNVSRMDFFRAKKHAKQICIPSNWMQKNRRLKA